MSEQVIVIVFGLIAVVATIGFAIDALMDFFEGGR